MKRVALYARVSTKDQDPALQLEALRQHAAQRGFESMEEYVDVGISGVQGKRPELDRLMTDAWTGKFRAVLVWKFDRFARSLPHLLQAIETFSGLGIDFISLTEQFDTSSPIGRAMLAVIGAMAQLERDLIRERVKAGVDRARARGKRLGRPPRVFHRDQVAKLKAEGLSFRKIGRRLGISPALALRVYREGQVAAIGTVFNNPPTNLSTKGAIENIFPGA